MRTLVTGGAGFLGSHLAERLAAAGDELRVLDDLSTGRPENLASLPGALSIGSVTDRAAVAAAMDGCDRVVHLAAVVGVRRVLERPAETISVNALGTRVVLDAALEQGIPVLVASSSEVYGPAAEPPFHEDAPLLSGCTAEARWSYAFSKAFGEVAALAQHAEHGLPTVVVRLFNVVGPRQRGRHGMVLPCFVRAALAGEPLHVHGDGRQSRCFLHVEDAARALAALLDAPAANGAVVNVGAKRPVPIGVLAERVRTILDSRSKIVRVPIDAAYGVHFADPRRRVPDVARLEDLTGFRPLRTLDDAIFDVAAAHSTRAAV